MFCDVIQTWLESCLEIATASSACHYICVISFNLAIKFVFLLPGQYFNDPNMYFVFSSFQRPGPPNSCIKEIFKLLGADCTIRHFHRTYVKVTTQPSVLGACKNCVPSHHDEQEH